MTIKAPNAQLFQASVRLPNYCSVSPSQGTAQFRDVWVQRERSTVAHRKLVAAKICVSVEAVALLIRMTAFAFSVGLSDPPLLAKNFPAGRWRR
jgi:hypothetical protein